MDTENSEKLSFLCRLKLHRWVGTGEFLKLRPNEEPSMRVMLCRCSRCPAELYSNEFDDPFAALKAETRWYDAEDDLRRKQDRETARLARENSTK